MVSARSMVSGCGPRYRFKCEQRISNESRKFIFQEFWSIEKHEIKYNYIFRFVHEFKSNKF